MQNHDGKRIDENGNDDEMRSKGCALWKTLVTMIELTNHVMIFLVTGYVLYLAGGKLTTTNVHVGFCTVGYVLLMSEAITILLGENMLSRRLTRRVISNIHWALQCLGASFSIAGIVLMYRQKHVHFTTIHGILGLASIVITFVVAFSGVSAIFATSLRERIRPVTAKLCHNILGITCFALGMIAQCYGYRKKWMTMNGENIANVCILLTGLITVFSLIGAFRNLRRQIVGVFF